MNAEQAGFCVAFVAAAVLASSVASHAADCHSEGLAAGAYRFMLFSSDLEPFVVPSELHVKVPPLDEEPPSLVTSSDGLRLIIEVVP